MFEKYSLGNRANIILVPQHDTKSITTMIMYPVGSRYESKKMAGVSHFIEHMMFKGTKKRKDSLTLTREIDRLGAEYNAFTGKEATGYYIKTDAKYTETALDILSDMLFGSVFREKDMEKEKTVIVEEIRMYNDNPIMNIGSVLDNVMFEGALGTDIAGDEKRVLSYLPKDVISYRNKFYQPENMTIVLAGAVTEETKELVEKYFGKQKNTNKVSKTYAPAIYCSAKKGDRVKVEHKKTDQAQLMLGWPGFAYNNSKKNAVLWVLTTILGGSMSSRLFTQIREKKGLAYSVRAGYQNFRDTGSIYVQAGLDAKNINKTIKIVQKEIQKIIEKGVTKRELEDAKTHINGSLTLSLEDSSSQARWYTYESLFIDKIVAPEEALKEIDVVTNDQIKALAKRMFKSSQMRVAVIGDIDKEAIII